ncbi:MAG: SMC-Scp complex subunit ScpB [Acidothermaceae bacterium]
MSDGPASDEVTDDLADGHGEESTDASVSAAPSSDEISNAGGPAATPEGSVEGAGRAGDADEQDSGSAPIEGALLRGAIEAILLVVDEPVTATVVAQVISVPEASVVAGLEELRADYDEAERGFELRQIGAGWRLYTRGTYAAYVERFVLDGQQARLTQAALETLAVVAYRQPVSRSRVSAVRGVNVDGVMRTLVGRGLVEEAGSEHESGAVLYRTTPYFLERLGLKGLAELPNLADFLPESTTIDQLEDQLSSEGRDV